MQVWYQKDIFMATAQHDIVENKSFFGLSVSESDKLASYCHLREPEQLHKKTLLQREGLVKSIDFMDTIDEDVPTGKRN